MELNHNGGVSAAFPAWLLIALANGFFHLSDRPLSVLAIFVLTVATFIAFWLAAGDLPNRVPTEPMSDVGIVSVTSATLYLAWLAVDRAPLLTSESALEREARQHRQTAKQPAEAKHKAEQVQAAIAARLKPNSLRQTRRGSNRGRHA